MSTIQSSVRPSAATTNFSLSAWIKRHPIIAYFILAFAGKWLFYAPILLSKRGLGVIDLPDGAAVLLFYIATYAGPFLSAFAVTGATDGKGGVRQLLHRIVQWRVGLNWYLLVLIGYPLVFMLGFTSVLAPNVLSTSRRIGPCCWAFICPQSRLAFCCQRLAKKSVAFQPYQRQHLFCDVRPCDEQRQYSPVAALAVAESE